MIADDKTIKTRKLYFGSDGGRLSYGETVPVEGGFYNITLNWKTNQISPTIEIIKLGLFFTTYAGTARVPELYIIPYGAKEVFLTYSILIPRYKTMEEFINKRECFYTENKTVKWAIVWP
ncbi:hypothetical protein FACS1894130_12150 [Spirochaetia bacterium]|nr:hypothetical protein FACS1894130_12150 [Spirochaetia bacterium]